MVFLRRTKGRASGLYGVDGTTREGENQVNVAFVAIVTLAVDMQSQARGLCHPAASVTLSTYPASVESQVELAVAHIRHHA